MIRKHPSFLLTGKCLEEIVQAVGIDQTMDELIDKMYQAFLEFDATNNIVQARKGFNYMNPYEGLIEWMPIRNKQQQRVLLKVVGYHPNNPMGFQLPTIVSTISKYNTNTGHLEALIDGALPTSLRTGAASAIASKLFGHAESKVLGLIGCGAQSVTQLHALSRVFKFEEVLYYDSNQIVVDSFQDRTQALDLDISFKPATIENIVEAADILCTATSIAVNEGPLFQDLQYKDWLHINAVGSDFPGKIELPLELLKKSYVSPDFLEQAIIEGECQQLKANQIGDDIISCLKKANHFEHLKHNTTVFDSTGMALEDEIVTDFFINHAKRLGIGQEVDIENINSDIYNPYSFLVNSKTAYSS